MIVQPPDEVKAMRHLTRSWFAVYPRPMSNDIPVEDIRHVTCGMMPEINRILRETAHDVLEIQVRQGVEHELVSAFGTGSAWSLRLIADLGCTRAVFTRAGGGGNPLELF